MSNKEKENNKKEESENNLNINLQINNLEEYNFTEGNKEITNDFQNIIKNQKSINFSENAPISENDINNNSLNSNNLYTNNNLEEEEENNIINNDLEDEDENGNENIYTNNQQESINKINNEDEELPLVTLNFITICQCCKNSFDENEYKPYLLKCGHFFCIKCITDYFTDKNGIKCPSDGLIAKKFNELTLLNNLIPKSKEKGNKNEILSNVQKNGTYENYETNTNNDYETQNSFINNNYNKNYCQIHKDQKLSHIIYDSNEIICVYCAFESFKKNPKREIKELSTQLNEYADNINEIITLNQNEVLNLHDALKKIKTNKETEEKAINTFFECLIDYIKEKQNEFIDRVNEIFNNNTKKLGDKLEEVTDNIEKSEKIKNLIENYFEKEEKNENNVKENYNEILSKYLLFQQKIKKDKQNLILDEYKFKHIDEEQIAKNCQNLGEIIILNKNNTLNDTFDFKSDYNINELKKLNRKKINFGEKKEVEYNGFEKKKDEITNLRGDKSFDNIYKRNNPIKAVEKKNKSNYIILDELSLNKNNNSFLYNKKNTSNFDNNEEELNNYLGEVKTINDVRIKRNKLSNKLDFKIKRKNTYTIKRNKNRNLLTKDGKIQYNYINYPSYNTNLTNYYLLNKIGKKEKERNSITVNNYEFHQTLKNSFNNNFNYEQNYNHPNYLNKIIDFNKLLNSGYSTATSKTQTNRNKITLINNKKFNKIINFK